MGASQSVRLFIAGAIALAAVPVPAVAGPGSTQPGATPVPLGSLIVLRDVPARNAIISGAGAALAVPMAPPSSVFDSLTGIGAPISDAEAASMTGSASAGGGNIIVATLDRVFGRQSMSGGVSPEHATGSSIGGGISGAIQTGLAPLTSLTADIPGAGH